MPTSEVADIDSFDIIVVPFPYTERLAEKRRPALVISNEDLHREGYVWIAMITGAGKEPAAGDLAVSDLASAGLPGASIVRTIKLATIEPSRILRRIGKLAAPERSTVAKKVASFLESTR